MNASRLPSRTARASLGAGAVRYSFTVTDFHRLPLAGLPAHPSTPSFQALIAELGKDVQIRFSSTALRFAPESRGRQLLPRSEPFVQLKMLAAKTGVTVQNLNLVVLYLPFEKHGVSRIAR